MQLTFLYGTDGNYKPAKHFALEAQSIVKKSDYDLGYLFWHNSFQHADCLKTFAETLKNFAKAGWFRIYGQPTPAVAFNNVPVRRLIENFPAQQGSKLMHIDLDKIPIPPEISTAANWSLSDAESTAKVVRAMLGNLGWQSLAFADFVFLLTSSQFTRDRLSCHVYFLFEKPRILEEMRSICMGFNTVKGAKLFDPAPYNPVQPDYISPPLCINFTDPIPTSARIYYSRGLSLEVIEDQFRHDVEANTPKNWARNGVAEKLGANWIDTMRMHVGTDRGINEPAFRAAAQLVHEVGRAQVVANLDLYASQLHEEAWKAILANGNRGSAADRQTYDVSRFRQYLESATRSGKNFGSEVDNLTAEVQQAIDTATFGDMTRLTDRATVAAAKTLQDRYPSAWFQIQTAVKKKLRGIMTISEFKQLIKRTAPVSAGMIPQESGLTMVDTADGNENELIRPILETYEFIEDQDKNYHIVLPGSKKEVIPLDGDVINLFYRDGLIRSGNSVSIQFGKKCLSVLYADLTNPNSVSLKVSKTMLGKRSIPIGDTISKGCWYNAGIQPDGIQRAILINPDKLVQHENTTYPRWVDVATNILPTAAMFTEKFGGTDAPTMEDMIEFYSAALKKYIVCDDDDFPSLTSWLVTALTNRPLAYIAEFVGPPNCGKSTGADLAKDLVDPSPQPLGTGAGRSVLPSKIDENFYALLFGQQITIFDNAGLLHPNTQDILCQVSTGLKFNKRIMYKQGQMEQYIQRPIILTGLSTMITRPDLATRAMTVNFSNVPVYDADFIEKWYQDKPFILGGLLAIVAKVMSVIANTPPSKMGKVSQREIVYAAVCSVLKGSTLIDAVAVSGRNAQSYHEQLESNSMFASLISFFQEFPGDTLTGTAGEILGDFNLWLENNRGVEKRITLHDGGIHKFRISFKTLESVNQFGWLLSKYHHAFEALSGWTRSRKGRNTKGVTHEYKRKMSLTDIL